MQSDKFLKFKFQKYRCQKSLRSHEYSPILARAKIGDARCNNRFDFIVQLIPQFSPYVDVCQCRSFKYWIADAQEYMLVRLCRASSRQFKYVGLEISCYPFGICSRFSANLRRPLIRDIASDSGKSEGICRVMALMTVRTFCKTSWITYSASARPKHLMAM